MFRLKQEVTTALCKQEVKLYNENIYIYICMYIYIIYTCYIHVYRYIDIYMNVYIYILINIYNIHAYIYTVIRKRK